MAITTTDLKPTTDLNQDKTVKRLDIRLVTAEGAIFILGDVRRGIQVLDTSASPTAPRWWVRPLSLVGGLWAGGGVIGEPTFFTRASGVQEELHPNKDNIWWLRMSCARSP